MLTLFIIRFCEDIRRLKFVSYYYKSIIIDENILTSRNPFPKFSPDVFRNDKRSPILNSLVERRYLLGRNGKVIFEFLLEHLSNNTEKEAFLKISLSTFQKLKHVLTGVCATGSNHNNTFSYTVCPFDKVTQMNVANNQKYDIGFFVYNFDYFPKRRVEDWNEETNTLNLPNGDYCDRRRRFVRSHKRRAEIEFVCSHAQNNQNTVSEVTEPEKCFNKMFWYTQLVCTTKLTTKKTKKIFENTNKRYIS